MVVRPSIARPHVVLAIALLVGAFAVMSAAATVEAVSDRDWSLDGWEWPETVTLATVLTLWLLWLAAFAAPRIGLRPGSATRKLIKAEIESRGYRVVPAPPLASSAEYALEPHFEYVLAHYLERRDDPRPFMFLQVGAFDGVTHDPLYEHARAGKWRGILVEPQPVPFERLRQNYATVDGLTFVNAAVDRRRRVRDLYRLEDASGHAVESLAHLSSFARDRLQPWQRDGDAESRTEIGSIQVECLTFEDVLRDVAYLDLLQIDAEGYDVDLLRLYDFDRCAPPIVRFEHAHITRSEWDQAVRLLGQHGYRFVREEHDTTAYAPYRNHPVELTPAVRRGRDRAAERSR